MLAVIPVLALAFLPFAQCAAQDRQDLGRANFSAEDRLAIQNVIYGYAFFIDYFEYENKFAYRFS